MQRISGYILPCFLVAASLCCDLVTSQVLEECRTDAYPPDPSEQLTEVVVDLDQPPKERWQHVVKPKRKEIADFQEYIRHTLTPFLYNWISKKVASAGLPKLPKEYAEEIEGIAKHLDMPVGDILLGNIFYELEKLCTSVVAQDSYGHIHHARNLDLGALMGWDSKNKAWKITDLLRPLAVTVDFTSQGKTIFKSVQFIGTVGVFTAVKPGKFSFSLNSRDPDHRFGGPTAILQWLHTSFDEHHFASFWARTVMQKARNYKQAKHLLSTEPLMAPVYFILAGTKRNQGIIISRSKTDSEQPLELNDGRPFLVQTNYDHWNGVPFYDDRRTPATKCLQKAVDAENGLEGQPYQDLSLPGLYNVLSTMPVLNKATMYTTLMDPKNGTMLSYRRYCPGYCYPW